MKKILVLFAHPAFHKSFINRALINGIRNMDAILVHELYELYPDFFIDVEAEQKLLLEHDIIVWHHPFYWYSAPAICNSWLTCYDRRHAGKTNSNTTKWRTMKTL